MNNEHDRSAPLKRAAQRPTARAGSSPDPALRSELRAILTAGATPFGHSAGAANGAVAREHTTDGVDFSGIRAILGDESAQSAGPPGSAWSGPGSGEAIEGTLRHWYEEMLGADLSDVRLHRDASADRAAAAMHAQAFAYGRHIVLAAGRFAPETPAGAHLLAHELAHTVQLGHFGDAPPQYMSAPHDAIERQAGAAADLSVHGRRSARLPRSDRPYLARAPAEETQAGGLPGWASIKQSMYQGMISGLRSARANAIKAMRNSLRGLPPRLAAGFGTLIDVFDEIIGLEIQLVLAIVGLVVGFVQGIVSLLIGLAKFIAGVIKWLVLLFYGLVDRGAAFDRYMNEILAAARGVIPGITKIANDWVARLKRSSVEEGTLMIGELTGEILAQLAALEFAASKAAQIPKISVVVDLPQVTRGGMMFEQVAVAVDVASPAAAVALVGSQAMAMTATGGGAGGGKAAEASAAEDLAKASGKDIDKALAPLDEAAKAPPASARTTGRKGSKGKAVPVGPLPVEDVVAEAVSRLKAQGVRGLPPAEYGTKLHAAIREVILERTGQPPAGWTVLADEPIGKVLKLRPETAGKTVQKYLRMHGIADRYPGLSREFRATLVEALKPDVLVRAPNGQSLVWDLTSRLASEHLAKTMFYAELIGRELGGLIRISESYWRKLLG